MSTFSYSLGGFESSVRIAKSSISGGFLENGKPYIKGEVELEGRLLVFHYGDLRERLTQQTKTGVGVKIEFTETQEVHWNVDNDEPYIGTISLLDHRAEPKPPTDQEIIAGVDITLPITMFHGLTLMGGGDIRFSTIHDLIERPTKDQELEHTVAFVKRVYFEPRSDWVPDVKRKSWSFGWPWA